MASTLTSRMKRSGMDFLRRVGVWGRLDVAVAGLVERGMKRWSRAIKTSLLAGESKKSTDV